MVMAVQPGVEPKRVTQSVNGLSRSDIVDLAILPHYLQVQVTDLTVQPRYLCSEMPGLDGDEKKHSVVDVLNVGLELPLGNSGRNLGRLVGGLHVDVFGIGAERIEGRRMGRPKNGDGHTPLRVFPNGAEGRSIVRAGSLIENHF